MGITQNRHNSVYRQRKPLHNKQKEGNHPFATMVLEVMDKKTFEYKHQLTKMMTCLIPAAFLTLIMLGYDSYAISTNFGEVSANLVQAGDVGSAQVAMGALAIAAMLALLLCYC